MCKNSNNKKSFPCKLWRIFRLGHWHDNSIIFPDHLWTCEVSIISIPELLPLQNWSLGKASLAVSLTIPSSHFHPITPSQLFVRLIVMSNGHLWPFFTLSCILWDGDVVRKPLTADGFSNCFTFKCIFKKISQPLWGWNYSLGEMEAQWMSPVALSRSGRA